MKILLDESLPPNPTLFLAHRKAHKTPTNSPVIGNVENAQDAILSIVPLLDFSGIL